MNRIIPTISENLAVKQAGFTKEVSTIDHLPHRIEEATMRVNGFDVHVVDLNVFEIAQKLANAILKIRRIHMCSY